MLITSKRTGLLVMIAFAIILSLVVTLMVYAHIKNQERLDKENQWRQQSCELMKKDYDDDQYHTSWKWRALIDKGCFK